jgi:hypothetical protein
VVESERNVEIQKNVAESKVKEAEGSKAAAILQAKVKPRRLSFAPTPKLKPPR